MSIKKKKIGRPVGYRAENPVSKKLPVRVAEDQLTNYQAAAETKGQTLSDWVRSTLDRAARRVK